MDFYLQRLSTFSLCKVITVDLSLTFLLFKISILLPALTI